MKTLSKDHTAPLRLEVSFFSAFLAFLILGIFIFLAFGQSLTFDFVWDDFLLIVENENLRQGKKVWDLLFQGFLEIDLTLKDPTRDFYRPLILFSYLCDYGLYGLQSWGFHLTNLLIHWVTSFVVWACALFFFRCPWKSLVAALIFALHPTHVENVCWIAGRTDLLCGLFYFAALFFFFDWCDQGQNQPLLVGGSALLYFGALLGKEMAISLPMVLILYGWLVKPIRREKIVFVLLLFILISVGYVGIRSMVLGTFYSAPPFGSFWQRCFSIPFVLVKYFALLLLLAPLDPHHPEGFIEFPFGWDFGVSLVILLSMAKMIQGLYATQKRMAFSLLFIPVTLLPVFNLGAFGDVLYADRFLYIPSFGLALLLPHPLGRNTRINIGLTVTWQ